MSVYFAQVGRYIKIGYSENPERRVRRLFASETRYGAPKDAPTSLAERTLLKVIDGGEGTERAVHLALDDFRVMGEWFIDEPEVRDFIATAEGGLRSYPRVVRPLGEFDRDADPVLGMSPEERAQLQAVMSNWFSGLNIGTSP